MNQSDLCKSCKDVNKYTPAKYIDNIRTTLDYIKANLPRAFVNLVLTLDVTGKIFLKINNLENNLDL